MKKPTISIIIPTYNRAAIINKTIDSFIAQDFNDWEMVVVDDHSKDNTKEVIEEYHKRDERISYMLNERKKGAQGARNTGLLHAQADWVVLFDSDDYVYPNFLSTLKTAVDDKTDVVTCLAHAMTPDGSKDYIEDWTAEGYVERELMKRNLYVNFDNCLIRREKLLEIGLLAEDCPAMQEYDTHIRLSRICTYKKVNEVLLDYIICNPDSISINANKNTYGMCYVVLHNQERWKELEYDSFYTLVKSFFRHVNLKKRMDLIKATPKLLLDIPSIYAKATSNFIKRKLSNK